MTTEHRPDPLTSLLASLAFERYPELLIAPPGYLYAGFGLSPLSDEQRGNLIALLRSDRHLAKRSPTVHDSGERSGALDRSFGHGGVHQEAHFAEMVIGSAWRQVQMEVTDPTKEDLAARVVENVAEIRRAAAREQIDIPVKILFTGVNLPEGAVVQTAYGPLRGVTPEDLEAAPPNITLWAATREPGGHGLEARHRADVVLVTRVPWALRVVDEGTFAAPEPTFPRMALNERIDDFVLAVMLAVDGGSFEWPDFRFAWFATADPFNYSFGVTTSDDLRPPRRDPRVLSPSECEALVEWSELLRTRGGRALRVATRRLLGAVDEWEVIEDRLLNAVVVWESLFGASGETTLRITGAIAWLLEPEPSRRLALQARLARVYGVRSLVVHGQELDVKRLAEAAEDAVLSARSCLQALLRDRPDLLHLSESGQRSVRLLMGN